MSGFIINTADGELRLRNGQGGKTVEICIGIEDPDDSRAVAELTPDQCDFLILVLQQYMERARNALGGG